MKFQYNDGGRSKYFKAQSVGDCVVRAIAIATCQDYKDVYSDFKIIMGKNRSPRDGVPKEIYHRYLLERGFEWVATMKIGSGCQTHLNEEELPKGVLIVRLSKHLSVVKDGVIHDTYDCSRGGTRCVYGYYRKLN